MKTNLLMMIVLLMALGGCAESGTRGDATDRDYNAPIDIRDNRAPITITYNVYGQSQQTTDTDQDTKNAADINPATSLKIPVAYGGATSTVEGTLKDVKSKFDTSMKDSNNPVDNSVHMIPAPVLSKIDPTEDVTQSDITPDEIPLDDMAFDLEYRPEHNRLFTWLPKTGAYYGGPITLTFPGCGTSIHVPEAKLEYKDAGGIYFDGTHKTGDENNQNRASVFGPAGCKSSNVVMTKG